MRQIKQFELSAGLLLYMVYLAMGKPGKTPSQMVRETNNYLQRASFLN